MKKNKATIGQIIRYKFDNLISKGTPALIGMLVLGVIICSLLSGVIIWVTEIESIRGKDPHMFEAFWSGLIHVLDPGTLGGDHDWHLRMGMIFATASGLFIISSLISIINAAFATKLQELKRSRSFVIEQGHTVIMGWSDKVIQIISELMIANENQKDSCIVIMSLTPIDEMKNYINKHLPSTGKTRMVYRYGNPRDPNDVHIPNINSAKSIIILSPEVAKSDAFVVKSILAIVKHPNRKDESYDIIAEMQNESDKEVAMTAGGDEVTVLVSNDVISKIIVQTARQTGLSLVYNDLVNFGNVEIYILPAEGIEGQTFKEIHLNFETVTLIGIKTETNELFLNPPSDTILKDTDELIVIAEDDDELILPSKPAYISKHATGEKARKPFEKQVKKTLILGWNSNAITIIKELDHYILPGSEVHVMAEGENIPEIIEELNQEVINQKVFFQSLDINSKKHLNKIPLEIFNDCIVLSYSEVYDQQEADAVSIITLMHLRNIASVKNNSLNIVSEMMDMKNRILADHSKIDDFIVSELIISNILAQLSENRKLAEIFDILFTAHGNEIYMKKVSDYIDIENPIEVYELADIALARHEIMIGYRDMKLAFDIEMEYGIILNPNKSDYIQFSLDDYLIVLSED